MIGLAGVVVLNVAVLGMAKELSKNLPSQANDYRWYKVLGIRPGGRSASVSALYLERCGDGATYIKLARSGWRLFFSGFGIAILSSLFSMLK